MDDETPLHPKIERELHRFDGVVAAIGIAGIIRLAHAGDQMLDSAPVGERSRECQEHEIAPGNEAGRQPAFTDFDRHLARERGIRDCGKRIELERMVLAKQVRPFRPQSDQTLADLSPHVELDPMTLAVVEADGLRACEAFQRPGQANRGILSAGKQHKCGVGLSCIHDRAFRWAPRFCRNEARAVARLCGGRSLSINATTPIRLNPIAAIRNRRSPRSAHRDAQGRPRPSSRQPTVRNRKSQDSPRAARRGWCGE